VQQLLEALAVLGDVDRLRRRADNWHARRLEGFGKLERRLAPVLNDDTHGLFEFHDLQDILEGEGFEVETIGGVVIGGDGLGIAVDHDGLKAILAQGHGRMHTAVIELDALADSVGASPQHNHLLAIGRSRLALLLVA